MSQTNKKKNYYLKHSYTSGNDTLNTYLTKRRNYIFYKKKMEFKKISKLEEEKIIFFTNNAHC